MFASASVSVFGVYRPQNWIGWVLSTVGLGLLTILDANTSRSAYIGLQVMVGVGQGILFAAPVFAVLAALPVTRAAPALALFTFLRTFAQVSCT